MIFFDKVLPIILFFSLLGFKNNIDAQTVSEQNKFKFSFSERVRITTYNNAITLNKDANAGTSFMRVRTSFSSKWIPNNKFELNLKLTNEFRNYFSPSTNDFYLNEIFIDQLYFKWNTSGFVNGILTVGRQNMKFGEGFIVMDGSPLDGSRSGYFNALKYDWNFKPKHKLTFWAAYFNKHDQLPVINGNDIDPIFQDDGTWLLVEQDESGAGIYYSGKLTNLDLETYYIRKDYLDPDKSLNQVKGNVNTLGGRALISLFDNLSTTCEAAYQIGSNGDNDRNAFGGYLYFDFLPNFSSNILPKTVTIGTIYLSGDDPSTENYEGWDPLWGRWPKWSESLIYTQIKEFGKVSYWSNFSSIYASMKFKWDQQFDFLFTYHHLMAPQSGVNNDFLGTGNTRGDLFIGKLIYKISNNMTGHFVFEQFIPGNYYFAGADSFNWARFQIYYQI